MATPPPVGWVRVSSTDPPLSVTARLAEDAIEISGYGGWQEVSRPRRRPLTTFQGQPGLHLTVPLLVDGFVRDQSVKSTIDQLTRMALPSGSDGEPPRVRIAARGSAIPYQDRTFVVADLTWGDAIMNAEGDRVRQQATLQLYEYVEDVHLTEKSAAKRRRQAANKHKVKAGAAAKRVKIKRSSRAVTKPKRSTRGAIVVGADDFGTGEDLLTIAARELGDADRWIEIAQLNGLRDPRAMTPGQEIRLP